MPISITDVAFYKSGASSLGGAIGSRLASQTTSAPSVVTGCTVLQALGNPLGGGTLSFNPSTMQFGWKPPGSTVTYFSTAVSSTGTYSVGDYATGMLLLSVAFSQLPTIYKVETLAVSSPIGTVFGSVTTTDALLGATEYRCLYFKNNHATLTASDLRLYVHAPAPLPQVLAIGVDPAGVGDGESSGVAQTVPDSKSAPSGVVFTSPAQAGGGISLGILPPGKSIAFWQRRTVPAMAYGPMMIASATIGVALVG